MVTETHQLRFGFETGWHAALPDHQQATLLRKAFRCPTAPASVGHGLPRSVQHTYVCVHAHRCACPGQRTTLGLALGPRLYLFIYSSTVSLTDLGLAK